MLNVSLLSGFMKESQEVGALYLLALDVDRLTVPYYDAAGLEPQGMRYGGWESREIAGHSLGHYLSAVSIMAFYTGKQELRQRIGHILKALEECQDDQGYIGGVKREVFEEIFAGRFEVERFSLGGVWVPWYNIHKIFAGLVDCYLYLKEERALKLVCDLADWAVKATVGLSNEAFARMLICEYGGMNEVFAILYELTGKVDYLKLARRFNDQTVLVPLGTCVDELEGLHANTQIPKINGLAKLYHVTGEEAYHSMAAYFFDQVIDHRSYSIGGNSFSEHFTRVDTEPLGLATAETCNTYNMCRLASYLFESDKDSRYMDYYERGLFNHILSSQDPDSGMKMYFTPTEPGHMKTYCDLENSFWCCTGSGMENPGRYNDVIYTESDEGLFVNQYIASEVATNTLGLKLRMETVYPYENKIGITVCESNDSAVNVAFRVPAYCDEKISISVNGDYVEGEVRKGYSYLNRVWQSSDQIQVVIDMKLKVYQSKEGEGIVGFTYGPAVLGMPLGRENYPEVDNCGDHMALIRHPKIPVPILVSHEHDLTKVVDMVNREKLLFETKHCFMPGRRSMVMKPFWEIHHERYALYLNHMTKEEYEKAPDNKDYQGLLESLTIDEVIPNQQQSELDHVLVKNHSYSDYDTEVSRGYREVKNGDFKYTMATGGLNKAFLCVTYWANDNQVWEADGVFDRRFRLSVNNSKLANVYLKKNGGNHLRDEFYELPLTALKGKTSVEVEFKTEEDCMTGRIFGVRITSDRLL